MSIYSNKKQKSTKFFEVVDAGGNKTALIEGSFNRSNRISTAKKILSAHKDVEQVGYWKTSRDKNFDAILTMAGGEFCGNAVRSLAHVLSKRFKKKKFKIKTNLQQTIEAMSAGENASIKINKNMLKLYKDNRCVIMGTSYFVVEGSLGLEQARKILKDKKMFQKRISGVMAYSFSNNSIDLRPFVWVRDTKTLYFESGCASGTVALSYSLSSRLGKKKFLIRQPSGAVYSVNISKSFIEINGPVHEIRKSLIS